MTLHDEPVTSSGPDPRQGRYSTVAIWLHWVIALALAFQLALGFAMPKGPAGFALYQLHKSVGITILVLSVARLAWRLTHRRPAPAEGGVTGWLAGAVHALLYAFMILGPLTGWAIVSSSRIQVPTMLFGVIPWPHLPISTALNEVAEEAHELIAWVGIALFLLHVAGALRHQWLKKDGLLQRMAPGSRPATAYSLMAAVVLLYFATGMYVASRYLVPAMASEQAARNATSARVSASPATTTGSPVAAAPTPSPTPSAEATDGTDVATVQGGPPPSWTIQPGGRLGFTVSNGSDNARGSFSDWSGTIVFDPDNPERADIRIRINLSSATLGDATQDEMLQGGDFFATAATPTATWGSTSVRSAGLGRYTANGTLVLRGVSRPQSITFSLSGTGNRRKVEGSGAIDRGAFGVGRGDAAAGLGQTVALTFAFDATRQE